MTSYTHSVRLNSASYDTFSINADPLRFYIKDPGSSITHFIAMIVAIVGIIPLAYKSLIYSTNPVLNVASMLIFMLSMILLYGASTTYHTFDKGEHINKVLKKLDHCMIPVLIAGSYTPVCLIVLHNVVGYIMLGIVWGAAFLAIGFKLLWVTCPKWISSIIYIVMGWTCIIGFSQIFHGLSFAAFMWLLIGGIFYTVGGVIYSFKMPEFNARHPYFGTHEIFHVFVMLGSACHYIMMYGFVTMM